MSIFKSSSTHLLLLSLFIVFTFATEAVPIYSDSYCTDGSYYRPNTTFQTNLNLLLSSLVSNATLHDGFFLTNISLGTPNEVKGIFLCRGDVTPSVCKDCLTAAARNITHLCRNQTESIIWYDQCMLRYTNNSFFNNIVPGVILPSEQSVPDSDRTRFSDFLAATLKDVAQNAVASTSGKKFATREADFTSSMKLYILAQCTPQLSTFDCNMCFSGAISSMPSDGKRGARSLLPACNLRYELYPFYNVSAQLPLPSPSSGKSNITVIIAIVVPIVVVAVLFTVGICFLRKRVSKKYTTFIQDSSNLSFSSSEGRSPTRG